MKDVKKLIIVVYKTSLMKPIVRKTQRKIAFFQSARYQNRAVTATRICAGRSAADIVLTEQEISN